MTRRKAKYKQDICPNCTPEALQVFLVGHNELPEPFVQASKIVLHAKLETYSLFRCEKCKSILLYRTIVDDTDWGPEEVDEKNPDWVTEWEDEEFSKLSELLCVLRNHVTLGLDPATPDHVKACYELGVKVRPFSNDLYALQLRKTLEAVCHDLGASEYLPNGRRAMLWQQIDELGDQNRVGDFICKAANELKDISNIGAHYSASGVTEVDIRKLEHLLALITTYV